MSLFSNINFWFGLGVLVQIFFTIGKINKVILYSLSLILILSFIVAYSLAQDLPISSSAMQNYLFSFFLVVVLMFSLIFKDKILPPIDELTLLLFNFALWYTLVVYFLPDIASNYFLFIIAAIFSFVTLVCALINFKLHPLIEAIIYTWFLLMSVFIIFSQVSLSKIIAILLARDLGSINIVDAFFAGMIYVVALSYIILVLYFVPIPSESQSFRERMAEWQEYVKLLSQKFSDTQLPTLTALIILVIGSAVLFVNYYFEIIPHNIFISGLVVAVPYVNIIIKKKLWLA